MKAQKRSLSQPPAAEPVAKAAKPAKRISLLDLALTFETMLDSNHVLDLAPHDLIRHFFELRILLNFEFY